MLAAYEMPLASASSAWWIWYAFQRALALVVLVVSAPVFLILYALVRLDSRGGFIYRQRRPGRGGQLFWALKVRTMTVGADRDPMLARAVTSETTEVTRVGRVLRELKLDELPQLWNVVRGDMAFVGPRPIAPSLFEHLQEKIPGFSNRLAVHPGLTSLGQVCIEENAAADDVIDDWSIRYEAERHYLRNRSVTYDLVIIGLTTRYCLRKVARFFPTVNPWAKGVAFLTHRS